ncbi:putative ATP synthase, F0 complex, subunit B/MI25 [Helianthus anomalus]
MLVWLSPISHAHSVDMVRDCSLHRETVVHRDTWRLVQIVFELEVEANAIVAILSICASSSKKIPIYNEEMIVARCFIGFIIFSRKSLGKTFKVTFDDGRIQAIQEESQQFLNPNEVVPPESNEQQRLLRISL